MSMPRVHWDDLPPTAQAAVQTWTGPVLEARTVGGGVNSGIAALLRTPAGKVFVKGVPVDHPQIPTQQREAAIAPYLPRSCPQLLWHTEAAGWDLLGYERLEGRHADYTPGSPDLPLVAAALAELQRTPCPLDPGLPLKRAEQRWSGYADPGDADKFAGGALLHTDLAPHNMLVDQRAHLIDWAWPTRGAAWIDPAVLILRLMEAGHTAADADGFARCWFPSWGAAPRAAVTVFSLAAARMWDEIARHDPLDWKKGMARHAHDWLTYQRQDA